MLTQILSRSVNYVPWRLRSTVKELPLLAALQRRLVARFLFDREFLHQINAGPAKGLNLLVRLPEDKGIWTGTEEVAFTQAIRSAIREGDVCIDAGAWHGLFAGVMALAGARKVYMFEPLPGNCTRLRKMMKLNPNLSLELIQAALSDKSDSSLFQVGTSDRGTLAGSPIAAGGREEIRIQTAALDDCLSSGKIVAPDVIKMDIEGAELLALQGARRLLTRFRPKLFMEIHSRDLASRCEAFLTGLSYKVTVLETGKSPDEIAGPPVCHFIAV
jgi:FkbM family methyltransferase